MPVFLSPAGHELLRTLRVDTETIPECGGTPPVSMLSTVPSEECGCPEEVWRIDGIDAVIHFEADGASEIFICAGDFEFEHSCRSRNMPELRAELFRLMAAIFVENASHG